MKSIQYLVAAAVLVAGGVMLGRYLWPNTSLENAGDADSKKPLYWVAPMDPSYRRDAPGKSPMGMDLVPVYVEEEPSDESVVRISPAVANNLGIRTAPAGYGKLPRMIDTVGYVSYSEDTLTHVHPRAEGWIEKLHVKDTGDTVERGAPLFALYSRELVTAQEELLAARGSGNARLVEGARSRLEALGMPADNIERVLQKGKAEHAVTMYAPITGVVAGLNVREGMFVKPGTEVMSLAELADVWVMAEVFERDVASIAVGQDVEMRFTALPGREFAATVSYVYPELDPRTRTARVRIRLKNAAVAFKPNMYADVIIHGAATQPSVVIPREALIRGRVDRVVVSEGEGRFRAVPVTVGIESGEQVQILDGLSEGEQVVVSGQFLIDSESNIEAELLRAGGAVGDDAAPAKEEMDHESMDHESMDHESMDHESMDHESMDHESAGGEQQ